MDIANLVADRIMLVSENFYAIPYLYIIKSMVLLKQMIWWYLTY